MKETSEMTDQDDLRPAIRSYEKAGFQFVKTLDAVPGRKASYVMRMDQQDVPTASSGVGTCERLR